MSAGSVVSVTGRGLLGTRTTVRVGWSFPDRRRALQLSLAALWLLDGVLQLQPFMFTAAFGSQMLAPVAHGNPGWAAHPIVWVAGEIGRLPGLANSAFAVLQLAIGIGIAGRRTLRPALVCSVVWSLAVWWFGEGLGGMLTGHADPLTGAPGAVLLYALLAVLLWPLADEPAEGERVERGHAVTERPLGAASAKALWVALWGLLAWTALWPANRSPRAAAALLTSATAGASRWTASLDQTLARDLAGHGLAVAVVLACACAVVGLGILAPARVARAALVGAVVLGIVFWVVGEDFGGFSSGQATDPNTGPLLVLLAAAYWPVRRASAARLAGAGGSPSAARLAGAAQPAPARSSAGPGEQ